MLNETFARRITTAMHAPRTTEALFRALAQTLLWIGYAGTYTLLFAGDDSVIAEVGWSTCPGLEADDMIIEVADAIASSLRSGTPTYLRAIQRLACGEDGVQTTGILPLRIENEVYGALLLHEEVPEEKRHLVEFAVEQLSCSLLHVQLSEKPPCRHASGAARQGNRRV